MVSRELGLDTEEIVAREIDQGSSAANVFLGGNKRGGRGLVKCAKTIRNTGFHAFQPVLL